MIDHLLEKIRAMKPVRFVLVHDSVKANALQLISQLVADGQYEVVIQPIKQDKTLRQLGGLFGVWLPAIEDATGKDRAEIKQDFKREFLEPIYQADYEDEDKPEVAEQGQWVELANLLQEGGELKHLRYHRERVSLRWATKEQMTRFMTAVKNFSMSRGIPLPELSRFKRRRF